MAASELDKQVVEVDTPSDYRSSLESSAYPSMDDNIYGEKPLAHDSDLTPTQSGVNVARAERDFAELSRELSSLSQNVRRLEKQTSRVPSKPGSRIEDVEKVGTNSSTEEPPWDLETTLRGTKAAETDAGIKPKRIGLIWDSLTVRGRRGAKNFVKTFPNAIIDFFNVPGLVMETFGWDKKEDESEILHNFRGVVEPGEMVLVLGRPGSGCTTFLKVIANQRVGYTGVDGEVSYGPFDADTFAKRFRGEAVYNQEDDIHHPTLTVGQTLSFALDTKTPGKRPTGLSTQAFKDRVIELLLKMFNIEHTANTVVGNQFIRGISGGEKKRVSIAEMMITSATVLAWDNTTRGLDSSTALDFAKSLRIMTNIYQITTFASLYQASESIYSQFDKVLVIDKGRQVYFGPTATARLYFESLGFQIKPRQTTPDFLTGCTDPFEREYKDGCDPENSPSSPETLAKAYDESAERKALDEQMERYRTRIEAEKYVYEEFEIANREAKRKYTPKSSVYLIPFHLQVWALMRRQFLIKAQDRFARYVQAATILGVAIVLGTVWLRLPTTSAGAFTRGGLLFISMLFNAFQAIAELGSTLLGRPILNKHRAFTFYRPGALYIAQILVDMAFSTVQILVFSVIVYFMCGLARDAAAFFTFVLVIICGYIATTVFFRTLGCFCRDLDSALKFTTIIVTLFVLTGGYLIQNAQEQVWLRWLFYLNTFGLGFASLMINEFKRLTLTCTGTYLVPSGPGYTNASHQTCTLAGSTPGSTVVSGIDYLASGFEYSLSDQWRNFGIILVLTIFFLVTNIYLGEKITFGAGGKTITVYKKENAERKGLNEELLRKRDLRQSKKLKDSPTSELKITSKAVLTWEDVCYDVPVGSGTRRLLSSVYGYVQPGKLTALMGASGAGKTTLLDVLAARKNIGVIYGDILVDGVKPSTSFQRGTSYAEQLDVHEPTQTVREALRFSAELRQPYHVPQAEKYAYVEEIISLLELETLADAIIGQPDTGLSVEERKRVTIGVELAAKPELLLFLDEPTSGLDSQSAFNIIRFLRKLAAAGQAILCTIHQPNSTLFQSFDRLLLLQRGGECIYFGDVGPNSRDVVDYFARYGAYCPPSANPAEWMLDAIGAGQTPRIGDRDWGEIWRSSAEFVTVKEDIIRIKEERLVTARQETSTGESQKEYATPLWFQTKLVCRRMNVAFWRSPNYGFTRLFNHVATALLAGLAFLHLDDSRTSLQYRVFVLFQLTVIPVIILQQVEPKYDMCRLIFYRESAAKAYKSVAFSLSMIIAEIPYSIMAAVAFFFPIYFPPGFQTAPDRAGYQFLMVIVVEMFAVTLGQTVAALSPSAFIASQFNPPIVIVFSLLCGVAIQAPLIPAFWRDWLYQIDPFHRLVSGMLVTELHGRPVICNPSEYSRFTAPPGQTCGEYMQAFFDTGAPGYLLNNATSACEYCAYKVGDQFFEGLGWSYSTRWRDLGILACYIVSNLFILFVGSRFLNYNRR